MTNHATQGGSLPYQTVVSSHDDLQVSFLDAIDTSVLPTIDQLSASAPEYVQQQKTKVEFVKQVSSVVHIDELAKKKDTRVCIKHQDYRILIVDDIGISECYHQCSLTAGCAEFAYDAA